MLLFSVMITIKGNYFSFNINKLRYYLCQAYSKLLSFFHVIKNGFQGTNNYLKYKIHMIINRWLLNLVLKK